MVWFACNFCVKCVGVLLSLVVSIAFSTLFLLHAGLFSHVLVMPIRLWRNFTFTLVSSSYSISCTCVTFQILYSLCCSFFSPDATNLHDYIKGWCIVGNFCLNDLNILRMHPLAMLVTDAVIVVCLVQVGEVAPG